MFKILEKWKILNLRVKYPPSKQGVSELLSRLSYTFFYPDRPLLEAAKTLACKMKFTGYDKYDCMVATPTSLSKTVVAIFNGRCHHW